jgi:hypothetical protein
MGRWLLKLSFPGDCEYFHSILSRLLLSSQRWIHGPSPVLIRSKNASIRNHSDPNFVIRCLRVFGYQLTTQLFMQHCDLF